MTTVSVIENKISSVKKNLVILERYKSYPVEEITNNEMVRGAVERYLYLVADSAISVAEAYIALKRLRKPTTLRESFEILGEEKLLTPALVEKMARMVGFRNAIAHDYEKINYTIVYDVLQNKLDDIREFIDVIENILR